MCSWYRVVAGLAVVAATTSACQGGPARPSKPPKLTVARLGPRASADVIAAGTINGKRWRIRLTLAGQRWCEQAPGWAAECLETVSDAVKDWRQTRPTAPSSIWTFNPALFGPVRPDVTRVSMRLSDGVVVELRPVAAFGHRWIGIVMPGGLVPVEAVAYAGSREVGHSVPYVDPAPGGFGIAFLSWLPPGVAGPPRRTNLVRGGGQTLVLHSGPWGNVLAGPGEEWPFPLGFRVSGALRVGGGLPQVVPMAFPSPARYVELVLVNGRMTRRVPLVLGAGLGFALLKVPARPAVLRWAVYDATGQRLSGSKGPPGGP